MKTLLGAVRLSAIIALLVVPCMQGQQPPQTQPGTPSTAAPESTPADKPTTQTTVQSQNDIPAAPASLYAPWSLELFYWFSYTNPSLRGGLAAPDFENLDYPGRGKYTPGVALSIPVSRTGMLNFSGFITKGSSNTTAKEPLDLFGTSFASGDYISSSYTIKDIKVTLQDLFFPFPRRDNQRWRIKTLWGVQYADIKTSIGAPFATDSAGNLIANTVSASRHVVYPTLGMGLEFHPTRNLELELNGSGFTIPHHATIADADGSLGYRIGAVELIVGGKFFHFKTSTQNAEYFKTTMQGGFAGLRFYPSMISVPCLFCKGKTTTATTTGPDNTSSSPSTESAGGTTRGASTSSSKTKPGTYVHRFSAGPTLSVEGLNVITGGTNTVTNSSTVNTMYQTKAASSRFGYGLTAQVAVTDRFAVAFAGILRRVGYTFDTTVTTSKPTVIGGVVTTVTTSTNTHEDTRANLIDIPATVRFYSRSRHEPGARWFVEGGAAWRKTDSIRTSMSSSDANSVLSCCTTTPIQPAHNSVFGIVAGAGVQVMDAFGIKVIPEVRYTRWMSPVFHSFTTNTQQNEVTAGFSITF